MEGRDPETLSANAEALAHLGVTLMTGGCGGPAYDLGPAPALLAGIACAIIAGQPGHSGPLKKSLPDALLDFSGASQH